VEMMVSFPHLYLTGWGVNPPLPSAEGLERPVALLLIPVYPFSLSKSSPGIGFSTQLQTSLLSCYWEFRIF